MDDCVHEIGKMYLDHTKNLEENKKIVDARIV